MSQLNPAELMANQDFIIIIVWAIIGIISGGGFVYLIKLGIDRALKFLDGLKEEFQRAIDSLKQTIEKLRNDMVENLKFIATQNEKNEANEREHKALWEDVEKQWEDIEKFKDAINAITNEISIKKSQITTQRRVAKR